MLDLNTPPKLSTLSEGQKELLSKIDDYALDYNIFLFRGMKEMIDNNDSKLISIISTLFASIPKEYSEIIFNPLDKDSGKLIASTTSKIQNRLLSLLIQERHKRDIEILNKQFENKINYIELEDPFKYEIKSAYFKAFQEGKADYYDQFNKLALLQSLEYDFEHELNDDSDYQSDDDLIDHFCDDNIVNFKLSDFEKEEDVLGNEIVRFILPLASQVLLSDDNDEE